MSLMSPSHLIYKANRRQGLYSEKALNHTPEIDLCERSEKYTLSLIKRKY